VPFPTNNQSNAAASADRLIGIARTARREAVKYIAQCDAVSVDAWGLVVEFAVPLASSRDHWATHSAVAGVQAEIMARFPGTFANEAAVTTALADALDAMDDTIAYVFTNVPKEAVTNWLLIGRITANQLERRVITATAQLTPLKAQLVLLRDAFSA
jgi:hypothetical protein